MKEYTYMESVHFYGKIWTFFGIVLFLFVPISICVYYNAWPAVKTVIQGLLGVAPIFWTVGIIEVFTFVPMLGAGGSYLAFMTGNLTYLKVPCTLNALAAAHIEPGTDEAEVLSTIAVAVSAITTTVIISLGVILLAYMRPILESPILDPAFKNILPALFGGLAVVYISKNPKLALSPLLFMIILFLLVPSLASSVGVLVPVGALVAIGAGRILYKKNLL